MSDSSRPYGLWPARLLCPWDSPGKNTGVGCHTFLRGSSRPRDWTCVSPTPALASSFFTTSAAWEALGCGTWGLVLWPGIEPAPPALGVQPLSHWSARQAPCFFSFKGRWTSSNTWDQRHSQRSPLTAEDEDHPSALWSAPFRPLLLALEVMAGIWHLFKLPFCTHTSTEQIISTKKNYKTCNSRKKKKRINFKWRCKCSHHRSRVYTLLSIQEIERRPTTKWQSTVQTVAMRSPQARPRGNQKLDPDGGWGRIQPPGSLVIVSQ